MSNEIVRQDVAMQGGLVQLQSISDAKAFCTEVFQSGIAPTSFKSPQAIFVAIQQGAELGLRPMQSLQGIAVVNGRTTLYDKTARGIALKSGLVESLEDRFEGANDDLTAITTIKRKGVQNAFVGKFSVADAKKACLWGKAGPWTLYGKEMLAHKASSRALNAGFADVLIGLPVFEDVQDVPAAKRPESNPTPIHDPLLEHNIIEAEITPNGASIHVEATEPYDDHESSDADLSNPPTFEPPFDIEIEPDEEPSKPNILAETIIEKTNGSLEVEGEIEQCWPPKNDKAPWNIVIKGVKMAVWKRSLPALVKAFEDKKPFKGYQFRAKYESEKKGLYTNNTLVTLTKI